MTPPPGTEGISEGSFSTKNQGSEGILGFLQTVMLPSGTGGIFGGSEEVYFGVQRGLGGETPPTREGVPENTSAMAIS